MARLINELETGAYVEPRGLSTKDFLEQWLADVQSKVSGTTFARYLCIVRLHLEKALGSVPLVKLAPLHIQAYLADALQDGRLDCKEGQGKGLSPRTVCHHHRVLSEALGRAVKWQLLARNPAVSVEPPRVEQQDMHAIDEDAAAELIEAAIGTRLRIPVLLALTTGMRRGEILALRWKDVDTARGFLAVVRSLEETKASGLRFKEVKKQRSRRQISIPELLIEALSPHREEQAKHREMYGSDYEDNDLICCREDGSIWPPSAFTSSYRDLLRRRKIQNVRFHDLRHSHASQLLRDGVNPKVISERLGHSKVGFTLDVYSHLLPGMQEEAARKTDSGLRAAIEKQRRQVGVKK
jgi:integrase